MISKKEQDKAYNRMTKAQKECDHEFDESEVYLVIPGNYYRKFCIKCKAEARKYNE